MVGYILLIGGLLLLSGSAFLVFCWAARDGQFDNLEQSAASIFDPDEPIGLATDRFPSEPPEA